MRTIRPAAEHVRSPDGTTIALWRSGQGRPLVALHGATIDHSTWDGVRPALEEVADVIAVDRRGHGASDQGPPTHSLDQEVADLAAVVAACPPAVDVLAHSYGGLVALEAARLGLPIGRLMLALSHPSTTIRTFPPSSTGSRALVDQGQTERAAETLLVERSGVPAEAIAAIRDLPLWPIVVRGARCSPARGRR